MLQAMKIKSNQLDCNIEL